jgi:ferredoxin
MATYQVRLVNQNEGLDVTINVDSNTFILDAAEENGINLSYSCRSGACSTCLCRVQGNADGAVLQANATFLNDGDKAKGFVAPCAALPKANMTLYTGKEEEFYNQ